MAKLAINGGRKIRNKNFPAYNNFGTEEEKAVLRVFKSGRLSGYIGAQHARFYGGEEAKSFETEWSKYFGVKHAIVVNSATSGLICAVGAIGTSPGDEIIVTPYSMSCSATAPLFYGAIPVFADIEEDFFCLSAKSIEERITKNTRAIIVVDLFGLPYDSKNINKLAKERGLVVIEDAAQAIFANYGKKYAGTLGDIGIHSLNFHKHIHTGEGGVIVTDNDLFAERARMIRNHAEAVIDGRGGFETLVNMVGFNFRMTEITAAIGKEQLKKVKPLVEERRTNVEYLSQGLKNIPCIKLGKVRKDCTHSYYYQPLQYSSEIAGVHRDVFVDAVKAELLPYEKRTDEGVTLGKGYIKPIHLLPLFQNKIAIGSAGWPWNSPWNKSGVKYDKGICPVAESCYDNVLINNELFKPPMTRDDLDDVVRAFEKVWKYKEELK
ncbi:MAG: DegT/DnrJ/EryC1/StrS family aminotransferase [Candidatus Curtissbacteria bacterium]|nr:DegT/DnrJ/EryC1/StrS family aminotransferase [Candidatus Curtissbacteria bacterium]